MTDDRQQQGRAAQADENDVAPGSAGAGQPDLRSAIVGYAIGLVLSIALTAVSFFMVGTQLVWAPSIPVALGVLGVAQIGVHLVFFLHITTAPDNTNNVLALAFGILIVGLIVGGSLWIMQHLDHNMLPMNEVIRMQR